MAAGADGYASAYFLGLQTELFPYAQSGGRFFLLDLARLAQRATEDPRYGFTPTSFDADGKPTASRCPAPCGGSITSNEQFQYYFGPDGLHLTTGGFELIASYMENMLLAPDTIAVQPGIVMSTTGGFVRSLQGRLDGTRVVEAAAGAMSADGAMGLGAAQKAGAPQAGPTGRFTSFAMGTFLGGSQSASAEVVGYDYDSTAGTAGIEYSINRNLIVGLAANYTTTSADLRNGANVDLDAIQGAAYLSYATRQLFADALVAYGSHDLGLTRPGVIPGDTIRSSTDAGAFALAARAGYLFDLRRPARRACGRAHLHPLPGRRVYRDRRRPAHLPGVVADARSRSPATWGYASSLRSRQAAAALSSRTSTSCWSTSSGTTRKR